MPGKDTNDTLFKIRNDTNKITNMNIERCHEEIGYLNNCTSNNGELVRCRLCATCKPGFKRTGSNTKCKKCPPTSTNRWLLLLGVFVMIIGKSFRWYISFTKRTEIHWMFRFDSNGDLCYTCCTCSIHVWYGYANEFLNNTMRRCNGESTIFRYQLKIFTYGDSDF